MILNKLKFIKKKLTLRNLKILLRFIRRGEFRHLLVTLTTQVEFFRKDKQNTSNFAKWISENTTTAPKVQVFGLDETIDIIVPIYNGFEYLDPLFNSIALTKLKYNLIVVNDYSPDTRVAEYLKKLEASDSRVKLFNNNSNLGFVKSVNKAFMHSTNHIALLNSDIELPPMWLERLMMPIIEGENVASATPFTNSGTLCSFPVIGKDNPLFESLTCAEIDASFQRIKPSYPTLPTGVGFCMGLNKNVLKEIGYFDEDTFAKGYGEENDWCQRAIKSGFKNVLVDNLFVFHNHGGSFDQNEKSELIKRNSELLSQKHPNYNADVAKFFSINPLAETRNYALMRILLDFKTTHKTIIFDHNLGGGASYYLNTKIQEKLNRSESVIIFRYNAAKWHYIFEFMWGEHSLTYTFRELSDIEEILHSTGVDDILVNELVTYPGIYDLLNFIQNLKNKFNATLKMNVHDYYAVCPMVNLINNNDHYCDLPREEICKKCHEWDLNISITKWHTEWGVFLKECDEITVFSHDTEKILESVYGKVGNIVVKPHQVNYMVNPHRAYKTTTTINIGLIGVLAKHKGLDIISDMLKIIKKQKLNVNIKLIGSSIKKLRSKNFSETGPYHKESLPLLTLENDIDLFFISSIIPETFSYTTEEAMKMGVPVAVFNVGAPVERVSRYDRGLVIDSINAQSALSQILTFLGNRNLLPKQAQEHKRILFIGEYISFSSRYRVDHFREQLLVQGIISDYTDVKKCTHVNVDDYHSVVIYRSKYSLKLESMINKFKKANKKVYYDIDDLTFDYSQIKTLDFLQDEDYSGFEEQTKLYNECMAHCDGFITSTNNTELAITRTFPNLPVYVNRNAASMEMLSLSLLARETTIKSADNIILGYFSGSKTHDGDFLVIADTIVSLMAKYDNLYLKVVGCLNLPASFDKFKNKVITSGFVDWRSLPELIASTHINLMPLENTFFHSCKSENKWMEAALVSVPTVCSFNNELDKVILHGVTGYLCNDSAAWEFNLKTLIENQAQREKIANAAHKAVIEKYITNVSGENAKDFVLR